MNDQSPVISGHAPVAAGILPAVSGGFQPPGPRHTNAHELAFAIETPGWKPGDTAGEEACRYEAEGMNRTRPSLPRTIPRNLGILLLALASHADRLEYTTLLQAVQAAADQPTLMNHGASTEGNEGNEEPPGTPSLPAASGRTLFPPLPSVKTKT